MSEKSDWNLEEASQALAAGKVSSLELTRALLARIEQLDPKLGAYLKVDSEGALKAAAESDSRRERGESRGLLDGIPLGIKDNLCTQGLSTTCASRMLENFVPPYDASSVSRLKNAGAVLLGKLNLDEFAMGSSTQTSAFKRTRNPWNLERSPGGSSGGSAAAVSAGLAYGALGTDTGGSIRQPAALCGVVGLKPTYGRVSRYGLVGFASSLDQAGPMTRSVRDAAILLQAIAGHDPLDSTSRDDEVPDYLAQIEGGVKGLRIGVLKEALAAGIDEELRHSFLASLELFRSLGADVQELSLPKLELGVGTYHVLASAEASSNLSRFDGVRYGFRAENAKGINDLFEQSREQGMGSEVKRRILLGTYFLSAQGYQNYYVHAQKVRTLIRQELDQAFAGVDLILGPTSPGPARPLESCQNNSSPDYLSDVFTIPANLAGLPAISVPCGQSKDGLPLGLQLMGPALSEATLLRAARSFEAESEWGKTARRPELKG